MERGVGAGARLHCRHPVIRRDRRGE
jgi:hypothetical protein